MIRKSNTIQGNDLANSSRAVVGWTYQKKSDVVYYFKLKAVNDSLLAENNRLQQLAAQESAIDTFQSLVWQQPIRTPVMKTDSSGRTDSLVKPTGKPKAVQYATYNYLPARVINNSINNNKNNYLTINRGAKDGIRYGMAVVTANGIVGRVAQVSENYATVTSVLSSLAVSAVLSDGTSGSVIWTPGYPDYVHMTQIPLTTKVEKGDSVFTSEYSVYPKNVLIGRVEKIDTTKVSNTQNLKLRLSTNFRNLHYVYVVMNDMYAEREALERKNE